MTDDPIEDGLLEAIRQSPADAHARSVYTDWLEQHDKTTRLAFLQQEASGLETLAPPEDAAWRAVVANPPVLQCLRSCGRRWSTLEPTDNDLIRTCTTCDQGVVYCTSLQRPPVPFVADAAIAKQLDQLLRTPMPYGNPPPPQYRGPIIVPAPSTFVRIVNWFRRR